MSQLTDAEIRVLRAAGFTMREINTQQLKFHNLLRVSPWLVEDLQKRECPQAERAAWVGLTDDDYEELLKTRDWGVYLIEAVEAKLKEKNT